jgi:hypothetical protein
MASQSSHPASTLSNTLIYSLVYNLYLVGGRSINTQNIETTDDSIDDQFLVHVDLFINVNSTKLNLGVTVFIQPISRITIWVYLRSFQNWRQLSKPLKTAYRTFFEFLSLSSFLLFLPNLFILTIFSFFLFAFNYRFLPIFPFLFLLHKPSIVFATVISIVHLSLLIPFGSEDNAPLIWFAGIPSISNSFSVFDCQKWRN